MPVNCGACGKFVSAIDIAKCTKCSVSYHRVCVVLPSKGPLPATWQCPECRKNVRRDNKADTPVRGHVGETQKEGPGTMSVSTPPAVTPVAVTTTMPSSGAASPSPVAMGVESENLGPLPEFSQDIVAASPSPVAVSVGSETLKPLPPFSQDIGAALKLVVEELRTLRHEVLELRRDVAELKASNDSSHTRMADIESRVEALEKHHNVGCAPSAPSSALESVVQQLRRELNDRDQELMANDIVVANVPETQGENPTHLLQLIATKLGVTLDERDIVSAERVGGRHIKATSPTVSAETRPRAIMVRLARRDQRDAVLNGARVRRGATTENLGFAGKPVRFFVNERLTKVNQHLFRQTRVAAGSHGWRFVWTARGRVLVRSKPGDATHRITSEEDILKIIGPYTDSN